MIGSLSGTGLSLNDVNDTVLRGMRTQESNLRQTLSTIGNADGSVDQADMLRLQQQVQQWSLLIDIQSTITKQISDSLKSVIQKSA